jgi:hypothetical protein
MSHPAGRVLEPEISVIVDAELLLRIHDGRRPSVRHDRWPWQRWRTKARAIEDGHLDLPGFPEVRAAVAPDWIAACRIPPR